MKITLKIHDNILLFFIEAASFKVYNFLDTGTY